MRATRLSNRVRGALRGGSRGVTLIEALVAMALVAIIAVAFLGALTTAARSAALADIRTNAESLARSELEYVKSQPYSLAPWEYEATSDGATCEPEVAPDWCNPAHELPEGNAGYAVTVKAEALPDESGEGVLEGIQLIIVTVLQDSVDGPVITLQGYNRDRG